MKVTRTSMLTNITRTRDLPITEEQLNLFESGDELIQNVFPELSADDREFIMTGISDEEWDRFIINE
jgi:hypothetical protein